MCGDRLLIWPRPLERPPFASAETLSRQHVTAPNGHATYVLLATELAGPERKMLYSQSLASRPPRGAKLDAIPSAHDHIAIYKRIGIGLLGASLVISRSVNGFSRSQVRGHGRGLLTFICHSPALNPATLPRTSPLPTRP